MLRGANDEAYLERQIVAALRRITRAIDLRSRRLLHECGLTAPQLATLRVVFEQQAITASALAAELHLGPPTVTGILDRLERRGLVQRIRGERDRRSIAVQLTDEGHDVLQRAPRLLEGKFQRGLAELPAWEQTQILANLQRIADMMGVSTIEREALGGASPSEASGHDF